MYHYAAFKQAFNVILLCAVDVKVTLADARHVLMDEIEERKKAVGDEGMVVLVGHALHHDLKAMHMDYWPVIDTSFIYSYEGLPRATPALAQLATMVLKRSIRQEVDSHHSQVEDALASLQLAQHQLEHGEVRTLPPPDTVVPAPARKRLLVHKLPASTARRDVAKLFKGLVPAAEGVAAHMCKVVAVIDGNSIPKDDNDEIPKEAKAMTVSPFA
eukprot:COSAG02_NODE_1404_length_12808_cov_64.813282_7_plen_215_part_00